MRLRRRCESSRKSETPLVQTSNLHQLCSIHEIPYIIRRITHNLKGVPSAHRPGWVDFDLGVPPSCPTAQPLLKIPVRPGRIFHTVELSKFKSTQPSPRADGTPCTYVHSLLRGRQAVIDRYRVASPQARELGEMDVV